MITTCKTFHIDHLNELVYQVAAGIFETQEFINGDKSNKETKKQTKK